MVEHSHEDNVALMARGHVDPAGGILTSMQSVATVLRARNDAEVRRMSQAERVELALRLGDEAIESIRAAHGVDRRTAIRLIERRRQTTRRPSACLDRAIG